MRCILGFLVDNVLIDGSVDHYQDSDVALDPSGSMVPQRPIIFWNPIAFLFWLDDIIGSDIVVNNCICLADYLVM